MPAPVTQTPNQNDLDSPATPSPTPSLRGSRWQLIVASILVALWIVFLLAMAIYS